MTQNNSIRFIRLGDIIESVSEKCGSNSAIISGVDINKQFISTRANLEDTDTSKYYLVRPSWFACNLMHIGRDERLPVAYNSSSDILIVTSAYYVFKVKDIMKKTILDDFLYVFFSSKEIDRLCWFYTDSSIRGNLKESRFSDIMVPVPTLERQRLVVDAWKSLRKVKEENEALAAPLFQLCQSKIQDLMHKTPMVPLGAFIRRVDERNSDNSIKAVKGMSVTKEYREPTSKVNREELANYKIVRYNQFGFIQTTNNEKCLVAVLSKFKEPIVISSVNEVFEIIDTEKLNPNYLQIWFNRKETDRYARFHSWGSARETFTFEDMQRFKVPVPDIKIQRAIADIFSCAQESKRIAAEAEKLSREICPALMQKAIHS